ncbi:MAG TPA: hypothetical protein VEX11_16030 [Acetobacteraceae bacterium]|nr:hypothetical protein [Acetobacteraceae bacterium]
MFAVVAVLAAEPAAAAREWNDGLPEDHFTQTCESIGGVGGYREEHSSQVRVGTFVDPQRIPKVGEVFYARVAMAAVGGCGEKSFIPEVVPPVGVEVAISAANPVRCHYTLPDGTDTALGGCPQALKPGPHGGLSLAPNGDPANAWTGVGKIPGTPALTRPQVEIVYIEFPLRATRPLQGLPGGPTCPERTLRTGPCGRDVAGDFLQVAVTVYDVSTPVLTAAIGLVVGARGANGPLVTVARSMRLGKAVKGIPVRVAVPADGARVSVTLTAKRFGRISGVKRNDVKAGKLRLRIKPTRRAARMLRRASTLTAALRVTVKLPGQATRTESVKIRLRR